MSQGHLKILYDLVIAEHWVSLIDSIRFESVQIGSSRFESALFNSSQFESVQIEPLQVGLTALIEPNRTEWATSIPNPDPDKRPTTEELYENFNSWYQESLDYYKLHNSDTERITVPGKEHLNLLIKYSI